MAWSVNSTPKDVYQEITNQIISLLEQGTVPWHKPWRAADAPMNYATKHEYRGANVFLLAFKPFTSPFWLGFEQAKKLGGHVKKGEHGTKIVKWDVKKIVDKDPKTGEELETFRMRPIMLTVFNAQQIEGIDFEDKEMKPIESIPICESVVENMPKRPEIRHAGGKAFYQPAADIVGMPPKHTFTNSEEYYSTLFHELTHSTGHASRLGRKSVSMGGESWSAFGSKPYAREELVAEMGAAFLCGHVDISPLTVQNSAAYVASWLQRLHDDKTLFLTAAQQGQKAADYILGKKREA